LFAAAGEQVLSALFILLADGQLYTATVADFSGTDPMIYRKTLRTERSDLKHLNGERLLMIFSAPTQCLFMSFFHSFLFLFFFCSSKLCEFVLIQRLRIFLLPGDRRGIHQLRQGEWIAFAMQIALLRSG
jgi:Sema domain